MCTHAPDRSRCPSSISLKTMAYSTTLVDTREPMNAQRRLRRKSVVIPSAIHMCSPKKGVHPQNTPMPTDQAISRGVACSLRAQSHKARALS